MYTNADYDEYRHFMEQVGRNDNANNKIETKMKPDEIKPVNLLLFVATFFSNVNAQDFKLGKVSFAELQEKFHPRFCCSSSDTI
jgi:hypothetical protein